MDLLAPTTKLAKYNLIQWHNIIPYRINLLNKRKPERNERKSTSLKGLILPGTDVAGILTTALPSVVESERLHQIQREAEKTIKIIAKTPKTRRNSKKLSTPSII